MFPLDNVREEFFQSKNHAFFEEVGSKLADPNTGQKAHNYFLKSRTSYTPIYIKSKVCI